MEALHDLVKSGKVRYIGASSMWATQFARMQFVAEKHGWTKFVSMQNHYNLLYREEEREMNRFCDDTGVGLIPVSLPHFFGLCLLVWIGFMLEKREGRWVSEWMSEWLESDPHLRLRNERLHYVRLRMNNCGG